MQIIKYITTTGIGQDHHEKANYIMLSINHYFVT